MKKLITLFLVLTGMVLDASAYKLYVNTSTYASWWTNVRIYAYNSESDNNGWNYSETGVVSGTTTLFGKAWYVFDMGNYNNAIVQYFETSNHSISNKSSDITGITNDRFVFIPGTATEGEWVWYESGYTFRCNVLDNWGATACNMTVENSNTLSYTLTKDAITNSSVDKIWFRILNPDGQIHPKADGYTLSYATSTTSYYNAWDTSWSFGIEIPSFDYEKIVVTAQYVDENDADEKWQITADAYVTKTVNGTYEYATLACPVPLSIVDASSVVAYPLTANASTGKITKGSAITTIPANEGALLENKTGENQTVRAKVLASADASASNDLHAFTNYGNRLTQPNNGHTYYILSEKDSFVAFYSVNPTNGNAMQANTAYLDVYTSAGARESFWFDDDETTTGIDKVAENKQETEYYNLSGQRVAQPVKGLYIVNGKKVIIK